MELKVNTFITSTGRLCNITDRLEDSTAVTLAKLLNPSAADDVRNSAYMDSPVIVLENVDAENIMSMLNDAVSRLGVDDVEAFGDRAISIGRLADHLDGFLYAASRMSKQSPNRLDALPSVENPVHVNGGEAGYSTMLEESEAKKK